jgi:HSP20 family protein
MGLSRWRFFRNLMCVCDGVGRFFNSIGKSGEGEGEVWCLGSWSPAVDIYETADALMVKAELPGFSREDVHVEIKQHALLLRGSRLHDREVDENHYHCSEREFGTFQRSFLLPTRIDAENVSVSCQDGLLTLRLSKAGATTLDAAPSVSQTRIKLTRSGSP